MSVLEERKIEYTSEFALKYIGMGETEGEKRGKKEGHVEATKKHLLRLLETKSLLTSDAQDRIDAESRDTVLEAWFERALTAETLDAVFGPSEPE